jgi:hypothetical protein
MASVRGGILLLFMAKALRMKKIQTEVGEERMKRVKRKLMNKNKKERERKKWKAFLKYPRTVYR